MALQPTLRDVGRRPASQRPLSKSCACSADSVATICGCPICTGSAPHGTTVGNMAYVPYTTISPALSPRDTTSLTLPGASTVSDQRRQSISKHPYRYCRTVIHLPRVLRKPHRLQAHFRRQCHSRQYRPSPSRSLPIATVPIHLPESCDTGRVQYPYRR